MEWLSLPEIVFPPLAEDICMMWDLEARNGFPSANGNLCAIAKSHPESFRAFDSSSKEPPIKQIQIILN